MSLGFELKNIVKIYKDVDAISNISFSIKEGENRAIIGPSGSGKSTLLRILAGLEELTEGKVLLDGKVISTNSETLAPYKRQISMVFQDLALWPNLTVQENVIMGLTSNSLTTNEKMNISLEALSLCKIEHLKNRKPAFISGGQQQRVALARALAAQPKYLLLDEPFSGLDLIIKSELMKDILKLTKEKQITIILVTHELIEAIALCERILVLKEGKIEEEGMLHEILKFPKSKLLNLFKDYSRQFEGPV